MPGEEILTRGQYPESFIKDFSEIIRCFQNSEQRDLQKEREKVVSANKYLRQIAGNSTISKIDSAYIYRLENSDLYNMGSKFEVCPATFDREKFGFVLGREIGCEKSELGAKAWFLAIYKEGTLYFISVEDLKGIQLTN